MQDNTVINLFENLIEYGTENKLSDLLAGVCNSSKEIKKIVFEFFFPDQFLNNTLLGRMGREFYSDDKICRIDFNIETQNGIFLIENKIDDRNDHYEEYSKRWDVNRIAFIANYKVDYIKYKYKYTWEDFYKNLKNHLPELSENDNNLAQGLLKYISGVCFIMEERNYDVNKVSDLGYLLKVFEKILLSHGYVIDNKTKGSNQKRSGLWGWNETKEQYIWFGIYYSLNDFSFWCGKTNFVIDKNKIEKLTYSIFDDNDFTDGANWFEMKKNISEEIKSTEDYHIKYKIFTEFLEEIIEI